MAAPVLPYSPIPAPQQFDKSVLPWAENEFRRIAQLLRAISATAVLGSMGTATDQAIGDLGNSTWQDITQYIDVRDDVGIIFDPAAGTVEFVEAGAYIFVFEANLVHNESNGSRHFFLRAADNSARITASIEVFTGRNVEGSAMGVTVVVHAAAGDTWKFQIGGTDDVYTDCILSYKSIIVFPPGVSVAT